MSATVKLDYRRFVKRVSNGASLSKYGYIGMMQANAEALKTAPWVEARAAKTDVTLTTNQLTKTDGVFDDETAQWTTPPTYTAYMDDKYDCFNQAGDAVARNATMCGYAGCVAYRFKLPTGPTGNVLQTVKLVIQRDRYLRAGVRVRIAGGSADTPSNDNWDAFVRGEGVSSTFRSTSTVPASDVVGVSSFGFLGQPDVPYLTASRAAFGTITLSPAQSIAVDSYSCLWVILTLEDPAAYWNMYSAKEMRQYYVEGSAMLVAGQCEFTFASEPLSSSSSDRLIIGCAPDTTGTLWDVRPLDAGTSDVATGEFRKHAYVATDVYIPGGVWEMSDHTLTRDFAVGYNGNGTLRGQPWRPSNVTTYPHDGRYPIIMAAYSGFFEGRMQRCIGGELTSEIANVPAAAFFVGSCVAKSDVIIYISRKKLLVPFVLTGIGSALIRPRYIVMRWNRNRVYTTRSYEVPNDAPQWHPYNYWGVRLEPATIQFNVWVALGKNISSYASETLQRRELWTADVDVVGEFRLIGSFLRTYTGDNYDPRNSVEDRETLPIDFDISINSPHTLLFTVYIPNQFAIRDVLGDAALPNWPDWSYDRVTSHGFAACIGTESQVTAEGNINPDDEGAYDNSYPESSLCAYFDKGVLNYGWSPEVTFTA